LKKPTTKEQGEQTKKKFKKKNRYQAKAIEIEEEFDPLPNQAKLREYKHFIGIDPGQTYVVTAFRGEEENKIPKHKKSKVTQVSTREFRHSSKITHFNRWSKTCDLERLIIVRESRTSLH
jgi:hypothetical protein